MDVIVKLGFALIPIMLTTLFVVLVLVVSHKFLLGNKSLNPEAKLPRNLILILLYVIGLIAIAIALPVSESTRNQVISLIGILLSGVIAFSSTTIVANVMAGIVLRFTKPFRTGDFIRVDGFFGRVTEKGLFDTEIQTEQRDLIAFTNSFLISHPLQVVRSSGTIISASLSLGYDVHHGRIEPLLIKAAELSDLEGPYVEILELGDFSITYRISGLLSEVKSMISSRSRLYTHILDCLHADNVEIVSPSFMNQRKLPDDMLIVPEAVTKTNSTQATQSTHNTPQSQTALANESTPEDLIFDKAEEAETKERTEKEILDQLSALESEVKETKGDEKVAKQDEIAKLHNALEILQSVTPGKDKNGDAT